MKRILAIAVLMLVCGLAHAQSESTPTTSPDTKNESGTTVSGAPARNGRGTRGKGTPIIAKTAQPDAGDDLSAPEEKESMKASPAPAAKPAKPGKRNED